MKRILLIVTVMSFFLGVAIVNFIPKQVTIASSGEIALKSKKQLIDDSSVIVKGTVSRVLPSKWSNPNFAKGTNVRNIIQTDVIVSIEDVYKNTPYDEKEIKVRINKGKIDNTTMTSEGYPDFIPGEEVILFLSEDDGDLASPNENYYVLTGMIQGKFSIKESNGLEKTFSNKVDTHSLIDKDVLELKTVKSEIKATLDDLKKNPLSKLTKEEIEENNKKVFGE